MAEPSNTPADRNAQAEQFVKEHDVPADLKQSDPKFTAIVEGDVNAEADRIRSGEESVEEADANVVDAILEDSLSGVLD